VKVLFVTWDGPQVNYLESLFLPIFSRLRDAKLFVYVLQFTWDKASKVSSSRQACEHAGIPYFESRVLRTPKSAGALLSAVWGACRIRKIVKDLDIDVVMPRSNLPALSTLLARWGSDFSVVFDADGLPLDERVDFAGASASSLGHRLLRDIEAEMVRCSRAVLTRSKIASEILIARAGAGTDQAKFHVIRNGRDADHFSIRTTAVREAVRNSLGIGLENPLIVYAGSLGEQYCLPEMLEFCTAVHRQDPQAHFLILTGAPDIARQALLSAAEISSSVHIKTVSAKEMPDYLASADVGLALRRKSFSMQAVAPIKLGEYLLCGLPVIATKGVGDTDSIGEDTGFLVETMSSDELNAAARWFCEKVRSDRDGFRQQCRDVGLSVFSLDASVQTYVKVLLSAARIAGDV
jgi:glycosyltransferase involved in cell wall biosynthesis